MAADEEIFLKGTVRTAIIAGHLQSTTKTAMLSTLVSPQGSLLGILWCNHQMYLKHTVAGQHNLCYAMLHGLGRLSSRTVMW